MQSSILCQFLFAMVCSMSLLSKMTIQRRIAISAPVLSPALSANGSDSHFLLFPSRSHVHTCMVSKFVLLCTGKSPSEITTGTRCTFFSMRL